MASVCAECGAAIEHVRDNFTGATFAIDTKPTMARGFELHPPGPGERARRAVLIDVQLHEPHQVTCPGPKAPKAKATKEEPKP